MQREALADNGALRRLPGLEEQRQVISDLAAMWRGQLPDKHSAKERFVLLGRLRCVEFTERSLASGQPPPRYSWVSQISVLTGLSFSCLFIYLGVSLPSPPIWPFAVFAAMTIVFYCLTYRNGNLINDANAAMETVISCCTEKSVN
jgi:hypothetical protein